MSPVAHGEVNLWESPEHALEYLARADAVPHRAEGERALIECLPARVSRVLDLGAGDGRLLSIVKAAHPAASAIALDFSDTMLDRLRSRFRADPSVEVLRHDLDQPMPAGLGTFDAVVSSFAIHHMTHARKRGLYEEIFALLEPGGTFCNLEHVSSPTVALHERFLAALLVDPTKEDPSNKLLDVETQLGWLRSIGFSDVDCHWKWRELALLAGVKSSPARR
jgi:ubiquinone/menaquinone biosynthesis C-methylase UbiE